MPLQFQRNARLFAKIANTISGSPEQGVWQIPVLAGFSFSQSTNSSEITINEAGVTSRRARLLFNDSIAPVEWSFSTYIRPTSDASRIVAPEQVLWAMLMGANGWQSTTATFYSTQVGLGSPSPTNSPGSTSPFVSPGAIGGSFINNATSSTANVFDFSASNVSSFPAGNIFYVAFVDGTNTEYFTMNDVVVNSVTIDFDIEGIATAQWSGFARNITRASSAPAAIGSPITTGVSSTTNFIRNRLSTLSLQRVAPSSGDTYSIVLTGGSFTVENNINYLIPEQLGIVNAPIANITGARSISGSISCYYDNDTANFRSAELWSDLITDTTTVRNGHNLQINVGGTTGPRLILNMPTAHLEIPTIGVDDLLTLEVNFHGIVANGNVDNLDEAFITYSA